MTKKTTADKFLAQQQLEAALAQERLAILRGRA